MFLFFHPYCTAIVQKFLILSLVSESVYSSGTQQLIGVYPSLTVYLSLHRSRNFLSFLTQVQELFFLPCTGSGTVYLSLHRSRNFLSFLTQFRNCLSFLARVQELFFLPCTGLGTVCLSFLAQVQELFILPCTGSGTVYPSLHRFRNC